MTQQFKTGSVGVQVLSVSKWRESAMTDVCKPVLSKLQITGGWRVKCKLFVKFASSKKTEVKTTR